MTETPVVQEESPLDRLDSSYEQVATYMSVFPLRGPFERLAKSLGVSDEDWEWWSAIRTWGSV